MKRIHVLGLALVATLVALGCGGNGASNNDQGVSVTFLGLFSALPATSTTTSTTQTTNGTGGCAQLPQGVSGGYIYLSGVGSATPGTPLPGFSPIAVDPAGNVSMIVGMQNNLYGQFFRADRVLLQYYIPGSTLQPPSTNVAVNFLAGPAQAGQTNTTAGNSSTTNTTTPSRGLRDPIVTSLPPAMSQVCNRSFAQVPIITAPIREWLNFNKMQLPEAPYDLEVVVQLSGLSSSGNRYDTNSGAYTFTVVPAPDIYPVDGSATPATTPVATTTPSTTTLSYQESDDESGADGLDTLEAALESQSSVEGVQ